MNTVKTKVLVSAILSIVLCVSLIAGATFALFTSESSVNVAITSGKVDVVASIDENSVKTKQRDGEYAAGNNTFAGQISVANGEIDISNIVSGDGVKFDIDVKNNSTVMVKYRTTLTCTDSGLLGGLKVTINGQSYSGIYGGDSKITKWATLKVGSGLETIEVEIELPEGAGNELQGKSASISYKVEAVQGNAVVADPVSNQAELNESISSATGDVAVELPEGTFTLEPISNKKVTIVGTEDTLIDMTATNILGAQNGGLDITFDGVSVQFDNTTNYKGITHSSKVTYKNCTLYGKQFLYASEVEFVDCTFVNSADYSVWTYGADKVTFEGCTFQSGGKAILIYVDYINGSEWTSDVTVNNCTFYDDGTLNTKKAAIEIGDYNLADGKQFYVKLTANNNVIYGFAHNDEGTATGTKLYGNKNSIPEERLQVSVSGTTEIDGTWIANGVILNNGVYEISSAEGLVYCATTFATGAATLGKTFKLTADIDMEGIQWTPWCTGAQYFCGTFDGDGHPISNLTITDNGTGAGHATGFIGRLGSNGNGAKTICNVKFDNAKVSGYHNVGVVVGYNEFGTVQNVSVSNSEVKAIHLNSGEECGDKAGALIGFCGPNNSVKVENCSATECTVTAARDAAQLIGYGYTNCTFTNLSATNVTVTAVIGDCEHTRAGIVSTDALIGNGTATGLSIQ